MYSRRMGSYASLPRETCTKPLRWGKIGSTRLGCKQVPKNHFQSILKRLTFFLSHFMWATESIYLNGTGREVRGEEPDTRGTLVNKQEAHPNSPRLCIHVNRTNLTEIQGMFKRCFKPSEAFTLWKHNLI